MHPATATLDVEQPVVCRIAEACRNRRQPIDFFSALEGGGPKVGVCDGYRATVRPDIRSIEHPFDAENELGRELPVVADLTATDKSGTGVAEARTEETIAYGTGLPRASHIAADIESSPIIVGDWRHIGRFHRQVGRERA